MQIVTDENRSVKWFVLIVLLFETIGCGLLLWSFSRPVKIQVSCGKLYVGTKGIDVTHRIKTVKRIGDIVTVRFNVLYQLNVKGSQEELDQLLEQLHWA